MAGAGMQANGEGETSGVLSAASQGTTASPLQGGGIHTHASSRQIMGFLPSLILHKEKRHKKKLKQKPLHGLY